MFRNFGRESKSKLMESRSFDNLKTFGMSRMESSLIKCMNNDGKKVQLILFRLNIEWKIHRKNHQLTKLNFTIVQNALFLWFNKALLSSKLAKKTIEMTINLKEEDTMIIIKRYKKRKDKSKIFWLKYLISNNLRLPV